MESTSDILSSSGNTKRRNHPPPQHPSRQRTVQCAAPSKHVLEFQAALLKHAVNRGFESGIANLADFMKERKDCWNLIRNMNNVMKRIHAGWNEFYHTQTTEPRYCTPYVTEFALCQRLLAAMKTPLTITSLEKQSGDIQRLLKDMRESFLKISNCKGLHSFEKGMRMVAAIETMKKEKAESAFGVAVSKKFNVQSVVRKYLLFANHKLSWTSIDDVCLMEFLVNMGFRDHAQKMHGMFQDGLSCDVKLNASTKFMETCTDTWNTTRRRSKTMEHLIVGKKRLYSFVLFQRLLDIVEPVVTKPCFSVTRNAGGSKNEHTVTIAHREKLISCFLEDESAWAMFKTVYYMSFKWESENYDCVNAAFDKYISNKQPNRRVFNSRPTRGYATPPRAHSFQPPRSIMKTSQGSNNSAKSKKRERVLSPLERLQILAGQGVGPKRFKLVSRDGILIKVKNESSL